MAKRTTPTPAMRQFYAFKEQHPGCVLFFRMGDFYELFEDDAKLASRVLGLTLTQRSEGVPMAGVPYHSADGYIKRMIEAGHRVAIADQVQDPKEAKGIVERAVTRVVTPGTRIDESLLDDAANHLAAVCFLGEGDDPDGPVAWGVVEASTGAFVIGESVASLLSDDLARWGASEVLYCETATGKPPARLDAAVGGLGCSLTARASWHFRQKESVEALSEQFGVTTLEGFGLVDDDPALRPAGVLVRYLRETQALDMGEVATSEGAGSGTMLAAVLRSRSLAHLRPPRREVRTGHVVIDAVTLRALEVERTVRDGALEGSLVGAFLSGAGRGCATPMGKRLLREWLTRPLADAGAITARQDAVATLVEDRRAAGELGRALERVQDVARIVGRIGLGRATPRDLVAMGRSLGAISAIEAAMEGAPALRAHREALAGLRASLEPIAADIAAQCVESPPAHLREGGLFRDGVDAELDECRGLQRESDSWLARYQGELIEAHDLPSLKVGYNKVFGYYIELPAAQARRAPDVFTRKQTLKNAERYITPELKQYEDKVLSAGERAIARELTLFLGLCARVTELAGEVARFGECVAELDVLACFAGKAASRGWVRPEVEGEASVVDIEEGRHPVLDEVLAHEFVPNGCALGVRTASAGAVEGAPRLALITGPNMAGKSTYIRQVALLVLLAHTGSFLPADRARVGIVDRIFSRLGADDALHRGQSTFMVEMIETARILHHATGRSLIVLDEIGRGTSTLDGLSLAWAIAEELGAGETEGRGGEETERRRDGETECGSGPGGDGSPLVLFATHYHELTELAESMPHAVRNLHVSVEEFGDEIVFLHRIVPGAAGGSYGIHVAKLAGLPRGVVARAQHLLGSLSVSQEQALRSGEGGAGAPSARPPADQMMLFTQFVTHPVVDELKSLDITRLSPMDAFDELRRMSRSVRESADGGAPDGPGPNGR